MQVPSRLLSAPLLEFLYFFSEDHHFLHLSSVGENITNCSCRFYSSSAVHSKANSLNSTFPGKGLDGYSLSVAHSGVHSRAQGPDTLPLCNHGGWRSDSVTLRKGLLGRYPVSVKMMLLVLFVFISCLLKTV